MYILSYAPWLLLNDLAARRQVLTIYPQPLKSPLGQETYMRHERTTTETILREKKTCTSFLMSLVAL